MKMENKVKNNKKPKVTHIPLTDEQAREIDELVNSFMCIGKYGDWLLIGTTACGSLLFQHIKSKIILPFFTN
jgi:hypothetical protein